MRISKWLLIGLISAGTTAMAVEPTPEELIKTGENMSIDQLLQLNKIVRDKYSQEYGEMISRFGFNLDFSMLGFKKNGAEDMPFSVGDLNPEPMIGFTLGFYWRCLPPLQVGVEYQGFTGWDSDRNQAGYSDADLAGYMTGLSANYHLLRMDKFGLWLNLTGGYGAFAMDTLNTPAGQASELHRYRQSYFFGKGGMGAQWRVTHWFSVFASGGYRLAEKVDLKEGGEKTGFDLDASGYEAKVGIGFNL